MKSFDQVYNRSKTETLNEQKETALQERAKLLSAMKKEFCINSFSECNESEKKSYNSMINEMWNPATGLTEAGHKFIENAEIPLNESIDDERLYKEIKRRFKADETAVLACVLNGKECPIAEKIKKDVESKIKREINKREFRKVLGQVVCEYAAKVINAYKF